MVMEKFQQLRKEEKQKLEQYNTLADIPPFQMKKIDQNNDDFEDSVLKEAKEVDAYLLDIKNFIGGPVRVEAYPEKWSKVRAELNGHLLIIKCSKFQRLIYLLKAALKIKPKTYV
jgi:hypothetical protein